MPVQTKQLKTPNDTPSLPLGKESVASGATNKAMVQRQQTTGVEDNVDYLQLSERLQAEIERLERQIIYNRSVANSVAPQPSSVTPIYYNVQPPSSNFDSAGAPESRQTKKDTIVLRDSVFATRIDTIFKIIQSSPTTITVPVPKQKIVEEKIDYKTLPPENILFASGQATIMLVYVEKLAYLADILQQNPELKIIITGHTDKTGSIATNEMLSLKRAQAVKSFFVNKGIGENRMKVIAVATKNPLLAGNTNNAKMQNRRVEIKIL